MFIHLDLKLVCIFNSLFLLCLKALDSVLDAFNGDISWPEGFRLLIGHCQAPFRKAVKSPGIVVDHSILVEPAF